MEAIKFGSVPSAQQIGYERERFFTWLYQLATNKHGSHALAEDQRCGLPESGL